LDHRELDHKELQDHRVLLDLKVPKSPDGPPGPIGPQGVSRTTRIPRTSGIHWSTKVLEDPKEIKEIEVPRVQ